ncbi:hypothetical protein B5G20_03460 [Collinsella sp. An7]|uniref:HAD-IIB family hydrolase n=1 Tax=Collinsella sp. An7 TaxID=1965651 RepID=UPI000B369200|nr:HAD-IIB family hydrolase [Collinsella sp. An7]OUN47783.1 hypothetical protein B5G20_03460 [Collinsella sp. An7]
MIKLFACDLDGTLLNILHTTDKTILRAVQEVVDAGAHLAIATGRAMQTTNDHGFGGMPVDILGSNGTIVRDRTGRLLKTFPIEPEVLEDVLRTFPTIPFDCATPDGVFIRGSKAQHEEGFKRDHVIRRIIMRGMRGPLPTYHMVFDQKTEDILKLNVCKLNCRVPDEGLARELKAYLAEHTDTLVNAPFNPEMFEISDRDANKGAGVAWLAAHYGISEDECAVYGDGGNDIAMLKRFKHSYAMANGSDEAKEAASETIGYCAFHAAPRHIMRTLREQRAAGNYTTIA